MRDTPGVRAAAVISRVVSRANPVGAEVGVLRGRMSVEMLKMHSGLQLYLVDSWAPAEDHSEAYVATGDIHARLSQKEQDHHCAFTRQAVRVFGARAIVVRNTSWSAAMAAAEWPALDFVFLDGDHSFEGCRSDIAAWWPRIAPGGWLCGHDYRGWLLVSSRRKYFGCTRAIDEFAARIGRTVQKDKDSTWFIQKEA